MKVVFFSSIYLCIPFTLYALVITEVMYDPEGADGGYEWIEIFNNASTSIDMESYKLRESDVSHSLRPEKESGKLLVVPGEYAVIADDPVLFRKTYPSYKNLLIDSAFSLSNTGEVIEILDGEGKVVSVVSYESSLGGVGDGNSLNRLENGDLKPRTPSPGSPEAQGSSEPQNSTNNAPSSKQPPKGVPYTFTYKDLVLKGTLPDRLSVYAGIPFVLPFELTTSEPNSTVSILWNFGDVTTANGRNVTHVYQYPGLYTITGELRVKNMRSVFGKDPFILTATVEVKRSELFLEGLSYNKNILIKIINNGDVAVDISHSNIIINGKKVREMPHRTIIAANASIILPQINAAALPHTSNIQISIGNRIVASVQEIKNATRELELESFIQSSLRLKDELDEKGDLQIRESVELEPSTSFERQDTSKKSVGATWRGIFLESSEQDNLKNIADTQKNISSHSKEDLILQEKPKNVANNSDLLSDDQSEKESEGTFPWRALMLLIGIVSGATITSLKQLQVHDENVEEIKEESYSERLARRLAGEWKG